MVAILSNQREVIFDAVRRMYTDVALVPEREFHFPTGRDACEFVGYPAEELDRLPKVAVESFAGVGYPFAAAVIRSGDTVLDIGSGSGTDAFIAAGLVGPGGRVIGLDLTEAMRDKLRANAAAAGAANLEVLAGNAEAIPLPDASVDVVSSNGVLNLVPDKPRAIREIARVLRAGDGSRSPTSWSGPCPRRRAAPTRSSGPSASSAPRRRRGTSPISRPRAWATSKC
jgi:arsenite methyltransferase